MLPNMGNIYRVCLFVNTPPRKGRKPIYNHMDLTPEDIEELRKIYKNEFREVYELESGEETTDQEALDIATNLLPTDCLCQQDTDYN